MKYNAKYNRWFTKGGLVYRYSKTQDKLVLCKEDECKGGYRSITLSTNKKVKTHRALWETFVGIIPEGFQIDHINAVPYDNRVENLRVCTPKENMNNPIRKNRISLSLTDVPRTEFGKKYIEHFGYGRKENIRQYNTEVEWYRRHGKCRWE